MMHTCVSLYVSVAVCLPKHWVFLSSDEDFQVVCASCPPICQASSVPHFVPEHLTLGHISSR